MTVPTMDDQSSRAPVEPHIGPGAQLREAREARRLTVEAAASQLRIDVSLLRALEADEYDNFAAPIFVTGHLRAYARLLDLAPEPLLDAYHRLGRDEPPPIKQLSRRLNFGSNSSLLPGVVVVLVLAIAAALFAGLQSRGERGAADAPAPVLAPAENTELNLPDAPSMPPREENGATAETSPAAVPPPDTTTAPLPAPSAVPRAPDAADTPGAVNGVRARLSLKADRSSWVEVRDANGQRLLYDLLDPGASRNVEGLAPFAVLLGYGPGVTVEFNGKLVDHSRYIHQDIARFRVGPIGVDKL